MYKAYATFLRLDDIMMIFLAQQVALMMVYLCHKEQFVLSYLSGISGLSFLRYRMIGISTFLIAESLKILP